MYYYPTSCREKAMYRMTVFIYKLTEKAKSRLKAVGYG